MGVNYTVFIWHGLNEMKKVKKSALQYVVDKVAGGKLTRRPKGFFTVSWLRQLDECKLQILKTVFMFFIAFFLLSFHFFH